MMMKIKNRNSEFVQSGLLTETPDAPAWLNETGKEYFNEITSLLFNGGILHGCDLPMVAILAGELSRYREAYDKMQSEGQVVKLPNGYHKVNQHHIVVKEAFRNAGDLAAQFGLTLNGREKIGLTFDPMLQFNKYHAQKQLKNWIGHLRTYVLIELQDELEKFINARIEEDAENEN